MILAVDPIRVRRALRAVSRPWPLRRAYRPIGDVAGHELVPGGVLVHTDRGGALLVQPLRGIGVRLRYSFDVPSELAGAALDPAGTAFEPPRSYAVSEEPEATEAAVENGSDVLRITADEVEVTVEKRPLRVLVSDAAGHELLRESLGARFRGSRIAHVVLAARDTRYFGLGEQAAALERTGRAFTLWNTDRFGYRRGTGPLYASFPFYVCVRQGVAHGVFYDNPYRSTFDFAAMQPGHVSWSADGGELRCYVLPGPTVEAVLARYTRLTGRTPLPPRWSLGYHQSRWSYHPEEEVLRVAAEFRARDIPCDALYLDLHHMDGSRVFTWHPERFPDPSRMLERLREGGFRAITIVDPGVKVQEGYAVYREGRARRLFVRLPDGRDYVGRVWPGRSAFPDFSLPAAREWWGELHQTLLDAGVSGIWNDMNEPSVFSPRRTMPDACRFDSDGRPRGHAELHNQYGLLMCRATYEGLRRLRPEHRPFVLTRAGFSGVQRYAAMWTGDNAASWDHLRLAIPMVLGLGLAGVPFAGADVGGFVGSPDAELYTRFLQLGAFLPFFRTHAWLRSRPREPWSHGPVHERANREVIRLRYRLLPHLYTAFNQHARDGAPVARPLFWGHEDDPAALEVDDQFWFGDHLMVAPVVRAGTDERTLYLPPGSWYRFPPGERYEGGRAVTVDAPRVGAGGSPEDAALRGIPLFARAGAVVAMQEPLPYVDARRLENLDLHVYNPGPGGAEIDQRELADGRTGSGICGEVTSELYEDAGEGFAYRDGAFRLTRFRTRTSDGELVIDAEREGTYSGAVPRFRLIVHGLTGEPSSVSVDGEQAAAEFDPVARVLSCELAATVRAVRILR